MIFPGVRTMGKYEHEAMKRERDQLWARRFHLNAGEGRRLDELIASLGSPDDEQQSPEWLMKQMQGGM